MSERADFSHWEEELRAEGVMSVERSLQFAQQLQIHISGLEGDRQLSAWFEALQLLYNVSVDARGSTHIVHTVKAFAYFDHMRSEDGQVPTLEYGEMYVAGSVGSYSYAEFENFSSLMLRLYNPQQQRVASPEDEIHGRLPVPLSIPVMCVESLINWQQ